MAQTLERPARSARSNDAVALQAVQRVADLWNIRQAQLATIVGVSPRTLRDWGTNPTRLKAAVRERLWHLLAIYDDTHKLFGDHSYADQWVKMPNDAFGAKTPLELMSESFAGLVRVRTYLEAALAY